MRKWIDQSTFDELLLANAEDNIERAIQSASAVLEAVQEFVPEAALFYRCLLYTSPSPRDGLLSRMPSSA